MFLEPLTQKIKLINNRKIEKISTHLNLMIVKKSEY